MISKVDILTFRFQFPALERRRQAHFHLPSLHVGIKVSALDGMERVRDKRLVGLFIVSARTDLVWGIVGGVVRFRRLDARVQYLVDVSQEGLRFPPVPDLHDGDEGEGAHEEHEHRSGQLLERARPGDHQGADLVQHPAEPNLPGGVRDHARVREQSQQDRVHSRLQHQGGRGDTYGPRESAE